MERGLVFGVVVELRGILDDDSGLFQATVGSTSVGGVNIGLLE